MAKIKKHPKNRDKEFWGVVKRIIEKADIVLEILDARMPEITRNKRLESYVEKFGKPIVFVINKADIVSRTTIKNIKSNYKGLSYVLTSAKGSGVIDDLVKVIKTIVKKEYIKVAFVGYPNTGKSSIINRLSKGGRARTSSESGFTKGLQLINGKGDLMLFDTPGVIPFDEMDETKMGLVSGVSPAKLEDPELVVYELIEMFKKNNPFALQDAYGIDPNQETEDIINEIGKNSNMLKKGGIVDERRVSIQIIIDWHKGKIKL